MEYAATGRSDGAQLVLGGKQALTHSGGYFFEPTLFRNVPIQSAIAREEIFGPVLSVIPFDDEAEAVRIANSTVYGLVAYVWTQNLSTGLRMVKGRGTWTRAIG
jgi:acyl-CoA reductase-like NAD-dependent aldehyde dehydrogenase